MEREIEQLLELADKSGVSEVTLFAAFDGHLGQLGAMEQEAVSHILETMPRITVEDAVKTVVRYPVQTALLAQYWRAGYSIHPTHIFCDPCTRTCDPKNGIEDCRPDDICPYAEQRDYFRRVETGA